MAPVRVALDFRAACARNRDARRRVSDACKEKWKDLKRQFRDAIDLRTKSGEGRDETATCPHFEDLRRTRAQLPAAQLYRARVHAAVEGAAR